MISISKMPRGFFFESLSCRGVVSFFFTSVAQDVCAQMTTKPHGFHWQDTFQLCAVDEGPGDDKLVGDRLVTLLNQGLFCIRLWQRLFS